MFKANFFLLYAYISDLPLVVEHSKAFFYTGDCKLRISVRKNQFDPTLRKDGLDSIFTWVKAMYTVAAFFPF